MKLTKNEKSTILRFQDMGDKEFILITPHHKTAMSLMEKNLAIYTGGYGYKHGGIMKLTLKGILLRDRLDYLKRI